MPTLDREGGEIFNTSWDLERRHHEVNSARDLISHQGGKEGVRKRDWAWDWGSEEKIHEEK